MSGPVHTHDCEACIFVGAEAPAAGEPRTNQVDLYIHLHDRPGGNTLIRRYSSEGADYGAVDEEIGKFLEKYAVIVAAAKAIGLIP